MLYIYNAMLAKNSKLGSQKAMTSDVGNRAHIEVDQNFQIQGFLHRARPKQRW
jgi:hypothetical protein